MALFNADALLQEEETEHTFEIAGFRQNETEYITKITIKVNKSVRETAQKAKLKYNNIRYIARNGNTRAMEAVPISRPKEYCHAILEAGYVSSSGDVVDVHSCKVIKALVTRFPKFADALASEFLEYFDGGEVFQKKQEQEDLENL
ncbi:hypothetical protein GF380_06460 [Candidatus Uhrbacteria bacterium]|nr:hypothetical protein [Candidatus Uhrbacteria bacterium]